MKVLIILFLQLVFSCVLNAADLKTEAVKTNSFEKYGISFSYPSELTPEAEAGPGGRQITVQGTDSALCMIQVYSASLKGIEDLEKTMVEGSKAALEGSGAKFPEQPVKICHRMIAEQKRAGKQLTCFPEPKESPMESHELEIYVFPHEGITLAMICECSTDDKPSAEKLFSQIATTLAVKAADAGAEMAKTKTFDKNGISFSYPSYFTLEQTEVDGIKPIIIQGSDTEVCTILVKPAAAEGFEHLEKTAVEENKTDLKSMGAELAAEPVKVCHRMIAGKSGQESKSPASWTPPRAQRSHTIWRYTSFDTGASM
jgi:hypothetical protein